MSDIDSEMYLRDGAPHATVCKVQMKNGAIGIGIFRLPPGQSPVDQSSADAMALSNALLHLNGATARPADSTDLQASLGHPAHGAADDVALLEIEKSLC